MRQMLLVPDLQPPDYSNAYYSEGGGRAEARHQAKLHLLELEAAAAANTATAVAAAAVSDSALTAEAIERSSGATGDEPQQVVAAAQGSRERIGSATSTTSSCYEDSASVHSAASSVSTAAPTGSTVSTTATTSYADGSSSTRTASSTADTNSSCTGASGDWEEVTSELAAAAQFELELNSSSSSSSGSTYKYEGEAVLGSWRVTMVLPMRLVDGVLIVTADR
jgi:hypothetical protein